MICAIDPGQTGALAFLDDFGAIEEIVDMPMIGKDVNAHMLVRLLRSHPLRKVIVEQVSSHPKQGVVSVFRFGNGYGKIEGAVAALELDTDYVPPSKWKPPMGLSNDKNLSRKKASDRWPEHAPLFARVKDDGRAEAALLGWWWLSTRVGADRVAPPPRRRRVIRR